MVEKKKQSGVNYAAPIICSIIIVLAVLTVVVAAVVSLNSKGNNIESSKVVDDYAAFTAIDSQELLDFLADKKTGFVYLGRPTCPNCKVFVPTLAEVTREDKLTVYYYDTDAANSNKKLKDEVLEAVKVTGVPTFMYVKDGVEVERLGDEKDKVALRDFIQKYL